MLYFLCQIYLSTNQNYEDIGYKRVTIIEREGLPDGQTLDNLASKPIQEQQLNVVDDFDHF